MMEERANNDSLTLPLYMGNLYKQWREACHISLEQTSELTGLSIATIQAIENGGDCTVKELRKYADFCFDYIIKNNEIMQSINNETLHFHKSADDDNNFIEDVKWEEIE